MSYFLIVKISIINRRRRQKFLNQIKFTYLSIGLAVHILQGIPNTLLPSPQHQLTSINSVTALGVGINALQINNRVFLKFLFFPKLAKLYPLADPRFPRGGR